MPISYTDRGLATYATFKDTYGAEVVVRQSSAAMLDAVWLFVEGGYVQPNKGSAILNAGQAATLILALQEWLDSLDATGGEGEQESF